MIGNKQFDLLTKKKLFKMERLSASLHEQLGDEDIESIPETP